MDATHDKNRARHSWERRAISWQVATLVNIAILLVTVTVALVSRSSPPVGRSYPEPVKPAKFAGSPVHYSAVRSEPTTINIAEARVDEFGTVAPAQYLEMLLRASPEELAALALKFNALPNNTRSAAAMGMFFQAWAELDAKSALAGAFKIRDVNLRRVAVKTVVYSASPASAPDLAASLIAYPDKDLADETNGFLNATIGRWADVDPVSAAQFLESIADTEFAKQYSAGSSVAFSWGSLDPSAAIDWVNRQNTEIPELLFTSVMNGWSKSDPAAAGAYVMQNLDRPGAEDAVQAVTTAMLEQDPNSATGWLKHLPPGDIRRNAERNLAAVWAEKDPLAAARWAETLERDDQTIVASMIASVWSANDWSQTRQWLGTITGEFRDAAIGGALNNDYDGRVPPTEALPLALSMMDREYRSLVVRNVIQRWARAEPQAAAAWIGNSVLPREERQELLSLEVFSQERSDP